MEKINKALFKLEKYIERENYRGFDPYDCLKSPIFKLPILRSNKLIRFGAQQALKRFPLNIRPILGIQKGYNPVTLGLMVQGYSYKYKTLTETDKQKEALGKIELLIEELKKKIPQNYSGACWGYDFDWEARYAKIPAYQPTVVATGIITNALYICYLLTKNEIAKELVISSANFILKDINRSETKNNSFCFSYSPFDHQRVYNASMKATRLLTQAYSLTRDQYLFDLAISSLKYVIDKQNSDGSWFYSDKSNGKWIDNYHSGYVLDCLSDYISITKDNRFEENLNKGLKFYLDNFIEDNRIPKFYHNSIYPIDSTAAGQTLLTLIRHNYLDLAINVAKYMVKTMQDKNGFFYYRNYGKRIDKTSFMRWSNAWMFSSLSFLLFKINNAK